MRLKALKDSKKELIDIQELRDFLRIDSDVFDANLKQFLSHNFMSCGNSSKPKFTIIFPQPIA